MNQYKQLTQGQRYQIYAFCKAGYLQKEIAEELEVAPINDKQGAEAKQGVQAQAGTQNGYSQTKNIGEDEENDTGDERYYREEIRTGLESAADNLPAQIRGCCCSKP